MLWRTRDAWFINIIQNQNRIQCRYYIPWYNTPIWRKNMNRYLSVGIACFEKQTVFQGCCSRKTVCLLEQMMDKYLSIFFVLNEGYCVYYPSNIFCIFENWGNIQSHDVFRPITCKCKYLMDYNSLL